MVECWCQGVGIRKVQDSGQLLLCTRIDDGNVKVVLRPDYLISMIIGYPKGIDLIIDPKCEHACGAGVDSHTEEDGSR